MESIVGSGLGEGKIVTENRDIGDSKLEDPVSVIVSSSDENELDEEDQVEDGYEVHHYSDNQILLGLISNKEEKLIDLNKNSKSFIKEFIDPEFILEDETTRNTRFNATLYDKEGESILNNSNITVMSEEDLKKEEQLKENYRLMLSTSSLSLDEVVNDASMSAIPISPSCSLSPVSPTFSKNFPALRFPSPVLSSSSTTATTATTAVPAMPAVQAVPPLKSPSPSSPSRSQSSEVSSLLKNSALKITVPGSKNSDTSSNYEKSVAFDTLSNDQASKSSLILKTRHKGYKFSRISRTFLCGYGEYECSLIALKWCIDELMDDGDTVVCLKVLNLKDKKNSKKNSTTLTINDDIKKECYKILENMMKLNNNNKKIAVVFELVISSKVSEQILKSVNDYDPSLLVVGAEHSSEKSFKNLIIPPKSMSKYCLQYSEVPVVVVKPNYIPTHKETKDYIISVQKRIGRRISHEESIDSVISPDKDTNNDKNKNDDQDNDKEVEEVIIDEKYFFKLLADFNSGIPENNNKHHKASFKSTISPSGRTENTSGTISPVISNNPLKSVTSGGFSPVRSLSPFGRWRKDKA